MGDMADFALDEVITAEEERTEFRTGNMPIEEAFDKGIVDELGVEEKRGRLKSMGKKEYPTIDQVNQASHIQICAWYRFLSSPKDKEEIQILDRICIRFHEFGGFTSKISKAINNLNECI